MLGLQIQNLGVVNRERALANLLMALSFDRSASAILAPELSHQQWGNPQLRPAETDPRSRVLPTRTSLSSLSRRRADREESVLPHPTMLPSNSHSHLDPMFRRASYQNLSTRINRNSIPRRSSQHLSYTPQNFDQNNPGFETIASIQRNQNYFGYLHTTDNAYTDQYVEEHALTSLPIPSKSAAPALRNSRNALLQQVRRTFATSSHYTELNRRAAIKMSKLYGLQQQQQARDKSHNEYRDDWKAKELQPKVLPKYLYKKDRVDADAALSLKGTQSRSEKIHYVRSTLSNRKIFINHSGTQLRQVGAQNYYATNIDSKFSSVPHTPNSQRRDMSSPCAQALPPGPGCKSLHSQTEYCGSSNIARHGDHSQGLDPKRNQPLTGGNEIAEKDQNLDEVSDGKRGKNLS